MNAGGQADLTGLQLSSGDQAVMLLNGDFGTGLACWFPGELGRASRNSKALALANVRVDKVASKRID